MNLKTGDKVQVITGKDKGNSGKIVKILKKTNEVIVEGINMITKHMKPNAANQTGGIVKMEAPINRSNVKLVEAGTKEKVKKEEKAEKKTVTKKAAPKKAEKTTKKSK